MLGIGLTDDEELEKRLAKLRQAKGATPYGQGAKAASTKAPEAPAAPKKSESRAPALIYCCYRCSPRDGKRVRQGYVGAVAPLRHVWVGVGRGDTGARGGRWGTPYYKSALMKCNMLGHVFAVVHVSTLQRTVHCCEMPTAMQCGGGAVTRGVDGL